MQLPSDAALHSIFLAFRTAKIEENVDLVAGDVNCTNVVEKLVLNRTTIALLKKRSVTPGSLATWPTFVEALAVFRLNGPMFSVSLEPQLAKLMAVPQAWGFRD